MILVHYLCQNDPSLVDDWMSVSDVDRVGEYVTFGKAADSPYLVTNVIRHRDIDQPHTEVRVTKVFRVPEGKT